MAGMESSPAIGAGIIPNGSFLATRLRALETKETVKNQNWWGFWLFHLKS